MKYIIVDDETASHDIIKDYANNLSYLSFQKSCFNAFEAIEYLNGNQVDLVFLDINMPKLTGLDFLKTLIDPPKIIITTAYKEFALEGYELNISDYLLKPFNFLRFVKAVNKVYDLSTIKTEPIQVTDSLKNAKIFIKDDNKYRQITLSNILFLEGYGNYVKIHLKEKMIISHQTLTSFTNLLPEHQFIRVHKSFIVAKDKIELIEGNRISIEEHKIPIGKIYKININKIIK